MNVHDAVKARVLAVLEYGYLCLIEGTNERAVLKYRYCSTPREITLPQGTVLDCTIRKIRPRQLSLDNIDRSKDTENFNSINVGDEIEGTIINVLDYGLFVRLKDGVDGLVHKNDLSHDAKKSPHLFSRGETLRVKVLSKDDDTKRISLSTKAFEVDPWNDTLSERCGTVFSTEVVTILKYGTFVRFEELGIDGMLHVSNYPENFVPEVGMKLAVLLQSVNLEERKVQIALTDNFTTV